MLKNEDIYTHLSQIASLFLPWSSSSHSLHLPWGQGKRRRGKCWHMLRNWRWLSKLRVHSKTKLVAAANFSINESTVIVYYPVLCGSKLWEIWENCGWILNGGKQLERKFKYFHIVHHEWYQLCLMWKRWVYILYG